METKNTTPYSILAKPVNDHVKENPRVYSILELYFKVNHLKQLYRQGWLKKGRDIPKEYCESVADHNFGTIFLAVIFRDRFFPRLDCLTVLLMLTMHECGETGKLGDVTPSDKVSPEEKHRQERACVVELFKDLPGGERYVALWDEFEEQKTPEAIFAREMDMLERTLQAKIYDLQHKKDLSAFVEEAFVRLGNNPYYSEFILRLTDVM